MLQGRLIVSDEKKFTILAIALALVCFLVLATTVLQEQVAGIGQYIERRAYYEKTISKKGLSLHKGLYWKEKE
jgi:hypothetical protein